MTTKEELEEHNVEQLIKLLKMVKVTISFLEKLEKESGYLEFQQEIDLKLLEQNAFNIITLSFDDNKVLKS
jgi:hypothetical protein